MESSIYLEIFGCEDVRQPAMQKKAPILPMDSELYPYQEPTGAADELCEKLQASALTDEILGSRAPVTQSPTSSAFEVDFLKCLQDGIGRADDVHKRAPERKRRIREIINAARKQPALRPILANSDAWDRLAHHCEEFISQTLLQV
jgi:hypothetical protein